MNVMKPVLLAIAIGLATPAFADTESFGRSCPDLTKQRNPEIADPDAACACLVEKANDDVIANLEAAKVLSDLTEATKAIMRECGYSIE